MELRVLTERTGREGFVVLFRTEPLAPPPPRIYDNKIQNIRNQNQVLNPEHKEYETTLNDYCHIEGGILTFYAYRSRDAPTV